MLTRWLQPKADRQQLILLAPVAGDAVPLSETPDEAFAQGRIGRGLAILPIEGTLVAPVEERIAKLDCRYGAVSAGEPGLMNVTLIGSTTG